ncbi:TRI15 [Apiospora arundinis]
MDSNTATSSHGSADTPQEGGEHYTRPNFIPECCLFCNKQLDDIDANQLHMQTTHGLFIPSKDKLLVDLDTLLDYLHLVIFGYNECISCGTQRNTPLAAQQRKITPSPPFLLMVAHENSPDMLGKNHCRFDIGREGSEFADFYDFSEPGSEIDEDDVGEGTTVPESYETKQATWTDESSMKLPSGKIISSRPDNISGPPRPKRVQRSTDTSQQQEQQQEHQPGPWLFRPRALTRSEKRETAFTTQLANMRPGDRQALAHLPLPQQRSIISKSLKQLKKARQLERRYQIATERSGNKTLMGRFVPDGPIRPNG